MIFVDTSAWVAFLVGKDRELRRRIDDVLARETAVTTDYVFDETLTLLSARGYRHVARDFGVWVLSERPGAAELHIVSPEQFDEGWRIFRDFRDKAWSFTDCTSFAVMKSRSLHRALALDEHFRQFPGIAVLPSVEP